MTIHTFYTEEYFPVILFIMLYMMVLSTETLFKVPFYLLTTQFLFLGWDIGPEVSVLFYRCIYINRRFQTVYLFASRLSQVVFEI